MPRIDVEVTHGDRVMDADGTTKGDIVGYYSAVAATLLTHVKDRPLTVQRFPRGIGAPGFVQQDFSDSLPDWMGRAEVGKDDGGVVVHPVANRPEAVVWLANQNCVTLHAWLSRRDKLHHPDRLVFDLDPSTDDFGIVRAAARALAGLLDDLGLSRYLQTTGSRGLHVVTPLRGDTDFDTTRQFARDVAELVVADDPAHRTVETRKNNRGDRVYIDIMRNAYAQTAAAPYTVRARRSAPVATPLTWDELDRRGLRADSFTIRDVPRRIAERGDPWADLTRHARSLARRMVRYARRHG